MEKAHATVCKTVDKFRKKQEAPSMVVDQE